METVNIHEAKTHLSRLVERAARGKPFVIARAGKPLVKVVPLDQPTGRVPSRFGFLRGSDATVPDDFDDLAREQVRQLFEGDA